MNISTSIHDTKEDLIVETLIETQIQRSHLIEIDINIYSVGWFDGLIGYSPELPQSKDYWDGYAIGNIAAGC